MGGEYYHTLQPWVLPLYDTATIHHKTQDATQAVAHAACEPSCGWRRASRSNKTETSKRPYRLLETCSSSRFRQSWPSQSDLVCH
jgi:hypothetical protein